MGWFWYILALKSDIWGNNFNDINDKSTAQISFPCYTDRFWLREVIIKVKDTQCEIQRYREKF